MLIEPAWRTKVRIKLLILANFPLYNLTNFRRYTWKCLSWFQHLKECNMHRHECVLFLHKHGSKFDEIAVFWILNFNDSPWVHTTSHLTTFDLYDLVWSNHCKWHSSLRKKWNTIQIIKIERIQHWKMRKPIGKRNSKQKKQPSLKISILEISSYY